MTITNDEFEAANHQGATIQSIFPPASAVHYDQQASRIVITLSSGLELAFIPTSAQGLENASVDDLLDIEISPSGLGIYFPKIDVDIYIPGLLGGFLGSKHWMAALGQKGGKVVTPAKSAASRRNGKLGGRPKASSASY